MKRTKLLFLGLCLACSIVLNFIWHARLRNARRLAAETSEQLTLLRQDHKEWLLSNDLSRSAQKLTREQLTELMKLRAEVGELRASNKRLQTTVQSNIIASSIKPADSKPEPVALPSDKWAFSGYNTPQDAFVSTFWAMRNGDVNTFLSSLTPDAEVSMKRKFSNMSDADIAKALQEEIEGLNTLRLDRTKNETDNSVTFVLKIEETDDGTTRSRDEAVVSFTNILGQWKFTGL
jgi:hypothetical protein